ncbi:XRE family transcriptional regulator [Salmonella enterica subsp. enterica serovar Enteritidis]|nr:XRE family transcriptional regulator [Salmonella enterica subsp. enterica]EBV3599656.1 XRE family transcriptional regulator [Salmonella enterica subsp. enterica serovar Virchow]EBW1603707.1 XRE family transcriptional regulator [Salmonella enterica subsp. enterica serovar Kottbus]EBW2249954.1 XRE family transcriptional regulator [Salmonella enterica subsp. enterica serovar Enteritidis]EBW7423635.1 XRE family transcriptional regulator [Salmonella enterica subsp. enterica serovar Stanley]ECF12
MFETLYQDMGEKIRELRDTKLRISQDEMASRLGMSRPSIANIEKGGQQVSVLQLLIIANALGVAPQYLLPSGSVRSETSLLNALPADADPKFRAWISELQG